MPLAECSEVVGGGTPRTSDPGFWDGDVAWATPKDLSELRGRYIAATARNLTSEGLRRSGARVLPPGSVLLSSRAPIGLVAINTVPMATNQGFKSLIPDPDRADAKYLAYWLSANTARLQGIGNGATFKEVSKSVVSNIAVPLPSLEQQRKIAQVLDAADGVRVRRREATLAINALADAIFIEMFGDPVANPRAWPRVPLGELGEVITGNTPTRGSSQEGTQLLGWVKSDNLAGESAYVTQPVEYVSPIAPKPPRTVGEGAILVTCIAGSASAIGNLAIADRTVAFNQQINAIVPLRAESTFLYTQLRLCKALIQAESTGGMKGMVSKTRFARVSLVCPPPDDQRMFAEAFAVVETLRRRSSDHYDRLNTLFASLQSRAFAGEL